MPGSIEYRTHNGVGYRIYTDGGFWHGEFEDERRGAIGRAITRAGIICLAEFTIDTLLPRRIDPAARG